MQHFHRPEGLTSARLRLTLALVAFFVGATFCFVQTDWHNQPTFYYLNQLQIPWWVYGVFFLVAGVAIVWEYTRPLGYLIAAIQYMIFGIAAWLAVLGGLHSQFWILSSMHFPAHSVGNPFAAINITTIAVIYLVVLKDAIGRQVDPDKETLNKISVREGRC